MRLNTGRLGPASAASSGSAKRLRAASSCWIEREPAFFLASSGSWIPPTKTRAWSIRRRRTRSAAGPQFVADGLQQVLSRRQDVLLAVAEARQVVALDLVEVGEDDVQLAGVAGDRDALEGGDRGRLHRLGGVVDQQHRGDATSVAPRDAASEHNVAAGRRACLARQRSKRLRPTNRVRPVPACVHGAGRLCTRPRRGPRSGHLVAGEGSPRPGNSPATGPHAESSMPGGGLLRMAVGWRPPPDELMCP